MDINYKRLEDIESNLLLCVANMNKALKINNRVFLDGDIDKMLNKINEDKSIIVDYLIPQAKKQYENILN